MSNKELEEAKVMFFQHWGSRYEMDREGVLERYRRYDVPTQLEVAWRKELMSVLLEKLPSGGRSALADLVVFSLNCPDSEILSQVLRHANSLLTDDCGEDSLGKVVWAEGITAIVRMLSNADAVKPELAGCAGAVVSNLIQNVLENPVKVDERWFMMYMLKADEKYVTDRAERALIEMKLLLASDEREGSR